MKGWCEGVQRSPEGDTSGVCSRCNVPLSSCISLPSTLYPRVALNSTTWLPFIGSRFRATLRDPQKNPIAKPPLGDSRQVVYWLATPLGLLGIGSWVSLYSPGYPETPGNSPVPASWLLESQVYNTTRDCYFVQQTRNVFGGMLVCVFAHENRKKTIWLYDNSRKSPKRKEGSSGLDPGSYILYFVILPWGLGLWIIDSSCFVCLTWSHAIALNSLHTIGCSHLMTILLPW